MAAAAGSLVTAGPAGADPRPQAYAYSSSSVAPPAGLIGPNGEQPTDWGVAAIPLNSSEGSATPLGSKKVGGGTWSYGTGTDGAYKGCYSDYIHPSKKHSASIAIGGNTDKDVREADVWAKAYGKSGMGHTCYTYWGIY
ncbi:lactococcin 972 family bacteriocin [Streptomyces sp. NPDC021115]